MENSNKLVVVVTHKHGNKVFPQHCWLSINLTKNEKDLPKLIHHGICTYLPTSLLLTIPVNDVKSDIPIADNAVKSDIPAADNAVTSDIPATDNAATSDIATIDNAVTSDIAKTDNAVKSDIVTTDNAAQNISFQLSATISHLPSDEPICY